MTLVLKMQIYLNVMATLRNSFNLTFCVWMCTVLTTRNTGGHRKLDPADLHAHRHLRQHPAPPPPQFMSTSGAGPIPQLLFPCFHSTSPPPPQVTNRLQPSEHPLPKQTSCLFKVSCHILCSRFAFLNSLTYAERIYDSYSVPVCF